MGIRWSMYASEKFGLKLLKKLKHYDFFKEKDIHLALLKGRSKMVVPNRWYSMDFFSVKWKYLKEE